MVVCVSMLSCDGLETCAGDPTSRPLTSEGRQQHPLDPDKDEDDGSGRGSDLFFILGTLTDSRKLLLKSSSAFFTVCSKKSDLLKFIQESLPVARKAIIQNHAPRENRNRPGPVQVGSGL